MHKTTKTKNVFFKDRFDSFHLSFKTDELTKDVSNQTVDDPKSSVFSNGKRAWFGEKHPETIKKIDEQLRKRFQLGDKKVVVCMYYPPQKNDNGEFLTKKLVIKDSKPTVVSRIIISTTTETTEITYGNMNGEVMELKPWVAYQTPPMIGGMLSYTFENSKNLVIPPKKGFRQVRKTKDVSSRNILIFDYMVTEEETNELANMFSKKLNSSTVKKENVVDESVENAIKNLQGN